MYVRLAFAVAAHLEPTSCSWRRGARGRRRRVPAQVPRQDGRRRSAAAARPVRQPRPRRDPAAVPAVVWFEQGIGRRPRPSAEVTDRYLGADVRRQGEVLLTGQAGSVAEVERVAVTGPDGRPAEVLDRSPAFSSRWTVGGRAGARLDLSVYVQTSGIRISTRRGPTPARPSAGPVHGPHAGATAAQRRELLDRRVDGYGPRGAVLAGRHPGISPGRGHPGENRTTTSALDPVGNGPGRPIGTPWAPHSRSSSRAVTGRRWSARRRGALGQVGVEVDVVVVDDASTVPLATRSPTWSTRRTAGCGWSAATLADGRVRAPATGASSRPGASGSASATTTTSGLRPRPGADRHPGRRARHLDL